MSELTLDAEELLVLARLDLQRGSTADALVRLKQAAAFVERPAEIDLELARLYAQLGLRKKAEERFRRYLSSTPDDVDALFQLGMVLFEEQRRSESRQIWDAVLSSNPSHPPARYYQALLAVEEGQRDAAITSLRALMGEIATDNLYFGKARDLVDSLSRPRHGSSVLMGESSLGIKSH